MDETVHNRRWVFRSTRSKDPDCLLDLSVDLTNKRIDVLIDGLPLFGEVRTSRLHLNLGSLDHLDLRAVALIVRHVLVDPVDELQVLDWEPGEIARLSKRYAYWVGEAIWIVSRVPGSKRRSLPPSIRIEFLVPAEDDLMQYSVIESLDEGARSFADELLDLCKDIDGRV